VGGTVKVTLDKTENRQAYLTIEMETAEVDEGLKKAYNRLVQKYAIPGFRKGKAPRPILEQYLGRAALLEDAIDHMAPEAYEKAVKEQNFQPIARPEVNLEKTEPVTYKMVVPLKPTVKPGDYHSIKMQPENIEVKDEDINNALEQIRKQHGTWEPVDRQINSRDMVNLDIESTVENQPYINQKDAQYEVQKDSEFPMKGFAEQLIGMKSGESKEFKLSFPADYGRAELAGKEASFKITVKEIKQQKLPELNDDLAKQVNPEIKTVDELKAKVIENLKHVAEDQSRKNFEQKVIDEAVKVSEVEYPVVMEEQEIDDLMQQQMQRWQMDDKGMDEYLKSINKTPEALRDEFRPVAIRSLKQALVLTEIARAENIQVNEEDLKKEVENMTRGMNDERKDKLIELFNVPQTQLNLASSIATRRTIEKLTEIAKSSGGTVEKSETAEVKPAAATEEKEVKE